MDNGKNSIARSLRSLLSMTRHEQAGTWVVLVLLALVVAVTLLVRHCTTPAAVPANQLPTAEQLDSTAVVTKQKAKKHRKKKARKHSKRAKKPAKKKPVPDRPLTPVPNF